MGAIVGTAPTPAFGPLSTLFHDAAQPRATESEVAWYLERISQSDGLALDVMCGAGRLLVPLAAQGAKVHGIDRSASMLARCEEKLAAQGLAASLVRQDASALNVPFRYGAAFIAGGAFQYITDPAAAVAALERIRAHLVPPGVMCIDCRIPGSDRQRLAAPLVEVRMVKLDDGSQIVVRSETTWTPDARLARATHRYAHRRGTQRLAEEHEAVTSTWYLPDEIADLVKSAGFRDVTTGEATTTAEDGEAFTVVATA